MEIRSIYALKVEDNPTEEQINDSVKKQIEQLLWIDKLKKKIEITQEKFIELVGKTIEEIETEYNLLPNLQ